MCLYVINIQTTIDNLWFLGRLVALFLKRNVRCEVARGGHSSEYLWVKTMNWEELCGLAAGEIERTLERLPKPLRERAARLPVTFEPRPNVELQADGIEIDTLGLFTGAEFADEEMVPMPSQIILFLENLREMAENDKTVFLEEVNTTFLHELGHFFGLDEGDLIDRGLE